MRLFLACLLISVIVFPALGQKKGIEVIAYYSGGAERVEKIPAEKITHIIFCFGHLQGNQFHIDNKNDSITIVKLVALKKRNPKLKVMLSLGGWGGCKPCSGVFATDLGRHEFALSVLQISEFFKTDGIDIDWEYPAIEGFPDHPWGPADKPNFTMLLQDLRKTLRPVYQISFAAGGFQKFLDNSVDWKAVVPLVDRINLMSYDLVNGYSTQTGHHTPLYSRPGQKESADNAIKFLIKSGVPANKLVIGSAFYGRMWENVPNINHGLYQPGKFKAFIDYKRIQTVAGPENGFAAFWDDKAKAPWLYNSDKQLFITFDDKKSMALKTKYAIANHLNGIMFWELSGDVEKTGLLDEIVKNKNLPVTASRPHP